MNITLSQEGMKPITISTDSVGLTSRESGQEGGQVNNNTQSMVNELQQLTLYRNNLINQYREAQQRGDGNHMQQLASQIENVNRKYSYLQNQIQLSNRTELPKSQAGMPSNPASGTMAGVQNVENLRNQRSNLIQQMNQAPESQRGAYEAKINEIDRQINAQIGARTGLTNNNNDDDDEDGNQYMDYAKKMGKQYANAMSNSLMFSTTHAANNAIIGAGKSIINGAKKGFTKSPEEKLAEGAKNGAAELTKNGLKGTAKEFAGNFATSAKAVAAAAGGNLGNIAAGATIAVIAAAVARFLGGTIFNAVASIGKFNSGNEMLASPKFQAKLKAIASKYPGPYPTPEDVKTDPRAKTKVGFFSWLIGGGSAGKRIVSQVGSVGMLVKNVNGITVVISTMKPITMQKLAGLKVMLANAFINKNGNITPIPVARAFLAKDAMVNASREAADIYFDKNGLRFNKENIIDMANKTIESFGPISSIQSSIIEEYCI